MSLDELVGLVVWFDSSDAIEEKNERNWHRLVATTNHVQIPSMPEG
jgi:hypothetical protein